MFKKLVSLLTSAAMLSSCATISTDSTLHGIVREPVKAQYENCIVRLGSYGYRYPDGFVIDDRTSPRGGFDSFKENLEKNFQFRLICRNIAYEDVKMVQLSDPFAKDQFVKIIESRNHPSEIPVFSFYRGFKPIESPYAYWAIFYVLSAGFIPLVTPEEEEFWFVKHMPGETKAQARLIENRKTRWWWTPFYLYPYSEKSRDQVMNNKVTEEALLKALNGG